MRGLKSKITLITGGAGGMGHALCSRFLEEGSTVICLDVNKTRLKEMQNKFENYLSNFHIASVDISNQKDVVTLVNNVENEIGNIDILINNAGWDKFSNFLDTDMALRDKVIDINLKGVLNVLHSVCSRMADRGNGRVITIASDAGRVGSSGQAVYSACKGGLISLSKTLARELSRKGLLFNVVCPGPTNTPMFDDFLSQGTAGQKVYDAMVQAIPLKRVGEPEDIPGIVAFLASDDASFITGQVISVSGGLTMHG